MKRPKQLINYTEEDIIQLIEDSVEPIMIDGVSLEVPTYAKSIMLDEVTCAKTDRASNLILEHAEDPATAILAFAQYLYLQRLPVSDIECITSGMLKLLEIVSKEAAETAVQVVLDPNAMLPNVSQQTSTKTEGNITYVDFKKDE